MAIVQGDSLSAAFYDKAGFTGIVVYRIEKDKLVGKWSLAGDTGRLFEETLTKK